MKRRTLIKTAMQAFYILLDGFGYLMIGLIAIGLLCMAGECLLQLWFLWHKEQWWLLHK